MKLVDLFRQLSFGELSNLAISNSGSGEIIEEKHPQLVQYVNDALLSLYTRFLLKENDLLLEQAAHITNYHLRAYYSETSGSDATYPYIKDLPEEPFRDDVIKILSVTNRLGHRYTLNDVGHPGSLFTPQPNVLQIPMPIANEPLSITYQASHPKLDDRNAESFNLLDQEIELPHYLENALKYFIAHKVYDHINGQENIVISQKYLAAYDATCIEIEQRDLANQTFSTTHTKLEQRGFV